MGLDGVELMMDVEDHFGIAIRDAEGQQLRTVADLVALIRARATAHADDLCPTSSAFYALRRTVRDMTGEPNLRIRPRETVASTLSPRWRRVLWRQRLPELLQSLLRPLQLPRWLCRLLQVAVVSLFLLSLTTGVIDVQIVPLGLFCAAVLSFGLTMACLAWGASVPPPGWTTWGEIARRIAGTTASVTGRNLCDESVVLEELRPLVANALGVDPERVVPNARFVEDLGMG